MKRTVLAIATAAIGSAALIGGAQASPIWRFPFKSAPYAVPHDHAKPLAAKFSANSAQRHAHQ